MNSKDVLSKIAKMLNLSSEEVMFTDAKTVDGTILQSPTFDLGEKVEVVSEDGTKTPAPDGEHEIALKDSEGNEVVIRIETKDGVITERENVEEAKPEELAKEDVDTVEETPLPGDPSEVNDAKVDANENVVYPPKGKTSSMLAGVSEATGPLGANEETVSVNPLPSTEDKPELSLETVFAKVEEMAYRITELEKALETKMAEVEVEVEEDGEEEEEELPKLDGAPVEMSSVFTPEEIQARFGKKVQNSQSSFLSKLYR
jgi:hypothetical protein